MIDIHTHILPALDDGSDSMEESLEMAEMAVRGGTRIVAATPHCNVRGRFENYEDSGERLEVFRQFRKLLEEEGIPLRVAQGMEIYGVGDIRALIQQRRLISLNHSGNYLIEFPFDMHPDEITDGLYMVFEAGGVPVLAHPERYYCVQDGKGQGRHRLRRGRSDSDQYGKFPGGVRQEGGAHGGGSFRAWADHLSGQRLPRNPMAIAGYAQGAGLHPGADLPGDGGSPFS